MPYRVILFATCVALFAACGGGGGDEATTTTTTASTTTAAPTTTAPSTTTTTLSPEDEVRQAFVELIDLHNELFRNPDPTRVDEYATTLCNCFEQELQQFTELAELGWHTTVEFGHLVGVEFQAISEENPNLADVIAVFDNPRRVEFVDHTGAVRQVFENDGPDSALFTVSRRPEGWRIAAVAPLDLTDERLAEVRSVGLP